jgi:hypothetical protein
MGEGTEVVNTPVAITTLTTSQSSAPAPAPTAPPPANVAAAMQAMGGQAAIAQALAAFLQKQQEWQAKAAESFKTIMSNQVQLGAKLAEVRAEVAQLSAMLVNKRR